MDTFLHIKCSSFVSFKCWKSHNHNKATQGKMRENEPNKEGLQKTLRNLSLSKRDCKRHCENWDLQRGIAKELKKTESNNDRLQKT